MQLKIRVLDVETTGVNLDDRVCEIGFQDLEVTVAEPYEIKLGAQEEHLIDPMMAMPTIAKSVHHITDEDLMGAKTLAEVSHIMQECDVLAAHNARFEKQFLGGDDWLCTLKCAYRLYPDAESHSNQYLRYYLNLNLPRKLAEPPHRALPDAYVTANILMQMLRIASIDQLMAWSRAPALLPNVTFGKHAGKKFREVVRDDPGYLQWVLSQDFDEDTKATAGHWLRNRNG
jgi:exodeoxyribonuclease X